MRLILALLLLPTPALPGAWPRALGETYVSIGHEGGSDGWTGYYLERGGPRNLTFGLDVGGHVVSGASAFYAGDLENADADGRVIAFVRIPLVSAGERELFPNWLVAAEIGIGADLETNELLEIENAPRLRLGLSVGRPLETPFGWGFTNIDMRIEPGGDGTRYGLAAVVGTGITERLSAEIGLFAEREDETYVTLSPVVQYKVPVLGDVRIGVGLRDDGDAFLKLGLARTF